MNGNNTKKHKDKKSMRDEYPVSVNAQQCIGPCYYSNTKIFHPITLDELKIDHNFCPVNTFVYTDPITKKTKLSLYDKCMVPTTRETILDEHIGDNIIAPKFIFSSAYFVKVYYKLTSLDDMLDWLDKHSTYPFKTKERLFNNSMVVYGDQLIIVDDRIVKFIIDLMIENLPKIYMHLRKYIIIKDDSVIIINSNDSESDETKKSIKKHIDVSETNLARDVSIIRAYIKDKFLGSDDIHQFMSKIIRYYKNDITNRYISDILVNHMIEYIIKRIKTTLE